MRKQTGFEFVLLSQCNCKSKEIPLFKHFAHVRTVCRTQVHKQTSSFSINTVILLSILFNSMLCSALKR